MSEEANIKDKIVSWLVDEDHEVKTETPPAQIPVEWIIKVTVKVPLRVNIIIQMPKQKRDRIIVQMNVAISPQHKNKMNTMSSMEKARLIHGVLESLAHLCPDCLLLAVPNLLDPNAIVMSKIIYVEEVNRSVLANTIRMLVNAFAIIVGRFNVELGTVEGGRERRGQEPPSFI